MPRNGSGVMSKPAGTTAVSGELISSTDYNRTIDDLIADANNARPVTAGGTGATNAAAALTALGAASQEAVLLKANNLSDLADADEALENLGGKEAGIKVFSSATVAEVQEYLAVPVLPTIATQAEAEVGTNNTDIMTPLRTAQAIAALAPAGWDALIEDQKPSSTGAGTFSSGAWRTRDLNTLTDPNGYITLTSNRFTPSVDGIVNWVTNAFRVNMHVSRIYNITDGAQTSISITAYANYDGYVMTPSIGTARLVAGKTYELQHMCYTSISNTGFGTSNQMGMPNIYTQIKFVRAGQ